MAVVIAAVLIFATALGVRCLQWNNSGAAADNIMTLIAQRYQAEADLLMRHGVRAFIHGGEETAEPSILAHPPGYPILIAGVRCFAAGDALSGLRMFQVVVDSLTAVLAFLIGLYVVPRPAAIMSGALAAFSPQFSFNCLPLLPDTVSVMPVMLAMLLVLAAHRRRSVVLMAAAGLSVGLSIWFRSNALLLAPFLSILVLVLFERGARLRFAGVLLISTVLAVVPITVRNWAVFGAFVPVSLGTGTNLVAGIADDDPEGRFGVSRYDHETAQREAQAFQRPDYAADLYTPDGIERDRARTATALTIIGENKSWFAAVMLRRMAGMLPLAEADIISTEPAMTHSTAIAPDTSPDVRVSGPGPLDASVELEVKPASDHVLRLVTESPNSDTVVVVRGVASGRILASRAAGSDAGGVIDVPFVAIKDTRIRVELPPTGADITAVELYWLGPAEYLWTRYPRIAAKAVQKWFRTEIVLPLAFVGLIVLVLRRRWQAIAVIASVPAYYFLAHAPLHTEPRYVLAAHYFILMFAAYSICEGAKAAGALAQAGLGKMRTAPDRSRKDN